MKYIQELKWWQLLIAIIGLEGLSFFFGIVVFGVQNEPCEICPYIETFGIPLFLLLMLPLVAIEEFAFRLLPNWILSKLNVTEFSVPVNIIASMVFGFVHGGPKFILIQGFGGMVLAIIYLRALKKGHKKAYLECTAYHFLFNASLIIDGIN